MINEPINPPVIILQICILLLRNIAVKYRRRLSNNKLRAQITSRYTVNQASSLISYWLLKFLFFCLRKSITYFPSGSVSLSVIKKTEIFTILNGICHIYIVENIKKALSLVDSAFLILFKFLSFNFFYSLASAPSH